MCVPTREKPHPGTPSAPPLPAPAQTESIRKGCARDKCKRCPNQSAPWQSAPCGGNHLLVRSLSTHVLIGPLQGLGTILRAKDRAGNNRQTVPSFPKPVGPACHTALPLWPKAGGAPFQPSLLWLSPCGPVSYTHEPHPRQVLHKCR